MGDIGVVLNYALLFCAILMAGGLSGYLSERAGIVNLGIDGMMCIGALFFGIYSSPLLKIADLGLWSLFIPLVLSALSTMVVGIMHGFACITLKANHVISGVAINLIGASLALFLNNKIGSLFWTGSSQLKSGYSDFWYLGGAIYGSSILILGVVLVIAILIFVIMHYTKTGLRYRAVGENPNAVDAQGISVIKYQWAAVLLSSLMAGLAGALFLFSTGIFKGSCYGLGYLSLAIMIAGAWRVPWIIVISYCFSLFYAVSLTPFLTNWQIPTGVVAAIPYIATLIILIVSSKKVHCPSHDGIPFDKTKR